MAQPYFQLGNLTLGWTPSAISHGASSKISQHDYVGGGRLFHVMGDDPPPISISGILSGPKRHDELNALKALRGTAQVLLVGSTAENVVVKDMEFNESWEAITYKLTLLVNTSAPAATSTAAQSVMGTVSTANASVSPSTYPAVSQPLSAAAQSLTNGQSPTAVLGQLEQAQGLAAASLARADGIIAAVGNLDSGSPLAAISALRSLSGAYADYEALSPISYQLGAAIKLTKGV